MPEYPELCSQAHEYNYVSRINSCPWQNRSKNNQENKFKTQVLCRVERNSERSCLCSWGTCVSYSLFAKWEFLTYSHRREGYMFCLYGRQILWISCKSGFLNLYTVRGIPSAYFLVGSMLIDHALFTHFIYNHVTLQITGLAGKFLDTRRSKWQWRGGN